MNNWMNEFISQCLTDVPPGKYRARTEKELRDHMEALRQDLTEAEALQRMGDPDRLRAEYKTAWERSLPARLEELGRRLGKWAAGWAVMAGTHLLISLSLNRVWRWAISFPADSMDPQIRMIRNTLGNLNNSFFWTYLFPFVTALALGVCVLGRSFRASRRPAREISIGLSLYGTSLYLLFFLARAVFKHRTLWEQFTRDAGTLLVILCCCVLLGKAIGRKIERRRELA